MFLLQKLQFEEQNVAIAREMMPSSCECTLDGYGLILSLEVKKVLLKRLIEVN